MSEHTPLPWQAVKGERDCEYSIHTKYDHPQLKSPMPVLSLAQGLLGTYIYARDEDIKLIIDSVNSHAKLIAQNKRLKTLLEEYIKEFDSDKDNKEVKYFLDREWIPNVRQALNESE